MCQMDEMGANVKIMTEYKENKEREAEEGKWISVDEEETAEVKAYRKGECKKTTS